MADEDILRLTPMDVGSLRTACISLGDILVDGTITFLRDDAVPQPKKKDKNGKTYKASAADAASPKKKKGGKIYKAASTTEEDSDTDSNSKPNKSKKSKDSKDSKPSKKSGKIYKAAATTEEEGSDSDNQKPRRVQKKSLNSKSSDSDSEEESPKKTKKTKKQLASKKSKKQDDDSDEDEEEAPKKKSKHSTRAPKTKKNSKDNDDDADKTSKKSKKHTSKKTKEVDISDDEDEETDSESADSDGDVQVKRKSNGGMVRLHEINSSRSVMVYLRLPACEFHEFYCAEKVKSISLNFQTLNRFLKRSDKDDDVMTWILRKDKPDFLIIQNRSNSNGGKFSEYEVPLIEATKQPFDYDEATFESMVSMPSTQLQSLCKSIKDFSDYIEIKSIGEQAQFYCKGESGTIKETLGKPSKEKGKQAVVQGIYEARYIAAASKCTPLSPKVELFMKNDFPVVITYTFQRKSKICFWISPVAMKPHESNNDANQEDLNYLSDEDTGSSKKKSKDKEKKSKDKEKKNTEVTKKRTAPRVSRS